MRKILYYSLLCLLWVSIDSCKDEEVSAPPQTSFSVDKTSGFYNATEFTFTVDQVDGDISLLPYGTEFASLGGILIPSSSFTNGKASVKFTYGKIGTFNAVVVSNKHSTDGKSVKNTYSEPKAIVITNDKTSITAFTFDKSTETKIKDKVKTDSDSIAVIVPYGTDVTTLKATFAASQQSTVSVAGAAQTSGTTANNFTSPVTYTVKSQDGLKTSTYIVTVSVTPVEKINTFKSVSGIVASKSASKDKVLPVSLDNVGRVVVIYDTLGAPATEFDSISFDYALDGKFAYAKYGGKKMKGKDLLNLTSSKQVLVVPQDSVATGIATYTVYAAEAPTLNLSFPTLSPTVTGTTTNFDVKLNVLTGTTIASIPTNYSIDLPSGEVVSVVKADGVVIVSGASVNYTKPVKFELTVQKGTLTFTVVYTATVNVLK